MKRWILQISAGIGPEEVRVFVYRLTKKLLDECRRGGLEVLSVASHGEERAPRSVEICLEGERDDLLQEQVGTHVYIHRSRSRGRSSRKRWFAGVSVYPVRSASGLLRPRREDLDISACRAGGPGGQHVNKTSSAIRVVHRPTGISVRAAGERSQAMNRRAAIDRIATILARREQQRDARDSRSRRRSHYHFERGSAVRAWVASPRSDELLAEELS